MRAVVIEEFGGRDKLTRTDLPRPRPAAGEVLLRVVAAGVNPVDCYIREGRLAGLYPHAFPLIPGVDVAGVIEEFGDDTARFRRGDRVWAFVRKPVLQGGCYAEYVSVPEDQLAVMPSKLLFEEAGGIPHAALTAYQSLHGTGELGVGTTVLVQGAAGGVGHFAVQLARHAGARVFGTAGTTNQEFVLGLGAAAAIDYTKEDVPAALKRHCPEGVDLLLDLVGGATLAASYDLVRPGGRLISIVEEPDARRAAQGKFQAAYRAVEPDGEQLGLLALVVDRLQLKPHVQKIYRLDEAAEAQRVLEEGHVRGKLVLGL